MNFLRLTALLFGLALAPLPAAAQMSPQPGTLTLPKKSAAPAAPAAPVGPAQAAPVAPVQQVAPFASRPIAPAPPAPYVPAAHAPITPAPLHKPKKPTPIVQAPANAHAQRPPLPPQAASGAKPAPATPASPATVVEPTAGAAKPGDAHGSVTNLPLPRWASLRADEVNLRVGPGMRFPIDWQYHRRDLPVQILRESEVWRLIEDQDGVKGWVHSATLAGRRTFVVKTYEVVLRASALEDASAVARLKPGVVGRIRACDAAAAWCEVQVADYRGFLKRDQFYGTDPGEVVGN